jgi:hypothetical protein
MRHAVGGIDRRLGSGGGGCLAVAAFAVIGPLIVITWSVFTAGAVVLWLLCLLAATAVHLLSARARLDTWRRHQADK